MRNRILIGVAAVLVLAAAGALLGMWLSWNVPVDPIGTPGVQPAQVAGEAPVARVDRPDDLPEPPQPRIDGSRGVPVRTLAPGGAPPMVSALENPEPDVLLSTEAPDIEALRRLHEQGQLAAPGAAPPAPTVVQTAPAGQVATVVAGNGGAVATTREPERVAAVAPQPWMQSLRAELERCASQGVMTRVFCNEQARWRYCNPNDGWGKIPECPRSGNN